MKKITELEGRIQDALEPKIESLESQVKSMKALLNPLTLNIIASSPFQDLDVNKTAALLEVLLPNMLSLTRLSQLMGLSSPHHHSHLPDRVFEV